MRLTPRPLGGRRHERSASFTVSVVSIHHLRRRVSSSELTASRDGGPRPAKRASRTRGCAAFGPLHVRSPPAVGRMRRNRASPPPGACSSRPWLCAPPALAGRTHECIRLTPVAIRSRQEFVSRGNRRATDAFVNSARSPPRLRGSRPACAHRTASRDEVGIWSLASLL